MIWGFTLVFSGFNADTTYFEVYSKTFTVLWILVAVAILGNWVSLYTKARHRHMTFCMMFKAQEYDLMTSPDFNSWNSGKLEELIELEEQLRR